MPTDIFDLSDLPNVFATRAAKARGASASVLVEAEEVIEEVSVADQSLSFAQQQNAADVEQVFNNIDAIQGNVERIAGNPLSELFGIFNPDFNIGTQQAKLSREQLQMKRIEHRSNAAKSAHTLSIQGAGRELELKQTEASIAQRELGNLTTEINIRLQARNAQIAERDRTLSGMTLGQIDAAIVDPTEINRLGLDIRAGDLRTSKLGKEKAILAAENLQLDMQMNRGKLTDAILARRGKTTELALANTPLEVLEDMQATARASGGLFTVTPEFARATGVPIPVGLRIGGTTIKAIIAERRDAETTQAKTRAEQVAAEINAQGILTVAENGLLASQGQLTGASTGGGLDLTAFPPAVQSQIIKARNLINASASAENEDAIQMQILAASTLKETQADINKQILAGTDKDQVPAVTEFLNTGRIQSSLNSSEMLAPAFLNATAFISNPLLSSMHEKLSIEALKIKEAESSGVDIFGVGFPTGKQKKMDNQAFVAQTIANYTASFATPDNPAGISPVTMLSGEASIAYTAQIMESLGEVNPEAFGDFVANGKWTQAVRGPDGMVSESDIVRELRRKDLALRQSGRLREGDASLYSIFRGELNNPILQNNYTSTFLTGANAEQAAMFRDLAGNQQVTAFRQRLLLLDALDQQLTANLESDPRLLQTDEDKVVAAEKRKAAFGFAEFSPALVRAQSGNIGNIIAGSKE